LTTDTSTWHGGGEHTPVSGQRAVPGTVVGGRYLLRTAIGTGGMGTVWQASDTVLRRDVAVKEVAQPPGIAPGDLAAIYERTMREARAAAALSHPSVVQVYDVVTEGGRPWIIMELLQARSLADMIISDGPVAARVVAKIGVAMLGALEVAHSAGVLHRDVKPANVLICGDGRCVLTDFGVARLPSDTQLTTPGMVLGSPHFISPERAVGGKFGPPSDLFSLGVTLYTAVEGRPPFDKGDPFETMRAVVEEEPAPFVRAGTLSIVLAGLLEKDPAQRWDVNRARSALRILLDGPLSSAAAITAHAEPTDPHAVLRPPGADGPVPAYAPPKQRRVGGRALLDTGNQPPIANYPNTGEYNMPPEEHWATPAGRTARRPEYAPTGSPPHKRHAAHRGGLAADLVDGLKHAAIGLWRRFQALPIAARYALPAVVMLTVLAVIGAAAGWFGSHGARSGPPSGPPRSSAPSASPPVAMDQVTERGMRLEVPKGWKVSKTGGYTDYTDPADNVTRIRVLNEPASTAMALVKSADRRFSTNKSVCAEYQKVGDFTEIKLAGLTGAQLEYFCTPPNSAVRRHSILRTVVVDKTAYEVNLSAAEDRYDEVTQTYNWATASLRLTVAASPSGN
jgi:serine/threonine protein kinase